MAKKSSRVTVLSPKGRLCFMNVFKTVENLQKLEEYSIDILFPKGSDIEWIAGKYRKVCMDVFEEDHTLKRPLSYKGKGKSDKAILKDGDARYDAADKDKRETYAPYKGHVYMSIRILASDGKPLVLDRDGDDVIDPGEFQSGDYGRVQFSMSAYRQPKWGNMVSVKLMGVQKLADGEKLGGQGINKEEVRAAFMGDEDAEDYNDVEV